MGTVWSFIYQTFNFKKNLIKLFSSAKSVTQCLRLVKPTKLSVNRLFSQE